MSQLAETTENTSEAMAFVSLENLKPFAKIIFGDGAHEVARCSDDVTLAYRPEGTETWTSLGMQLEDGWPQIGGGIILSQSNALARFVRTHVVRVENPSDPKAAVPYALDDLAWVIRETDDPQVIEVSVAGGEWGNVTLNEEIPMDDFKGRAVAALIKAAPDLELEMSADMMGWASRLGAGAQIVPVM